MTIAAVVVHDSILLYGTEVHILEGGLEVLKVHGIVRVGKHGIELRGSLGLGEAAAYVIAVDAGIVLETEVEVVEVGFGVDEFGVVREGVVVVGGIHGSLIVEFGL